MAGFKQILLFLIVFSSPQIGLNSETKEEELVESESKDGKLEIIKQIKKVNDDGSYTIGYEADDGSFKIESRDVLGNIKGTYGYVDDSGQIKRVSYSTSNASEILTKPSESTVVQRIPKLNRTITTRRPLFSTTQSTPLTRYTKIRTSTTTPKPNYGEIINVDSEIIKTTATPKILLQGRPILRSTPASQIQKSEGQIIRPEIVTERSTELPLFRRLALKHLSEKPVTEEPDSKGNILRRQLISDKVSNYDPQQHVFNIQQSLGNDVTDVYSASVTTGTPRPLFTTTTRPRALLSTTTPRIISNKPTVRYQTNYHKNLLQDVESSPEETSTTETNLGSTTPTPVPVVQIPANRPAEHLIAMKHPYQRGTILIPLTQLQNGRFLIDNQYYQQRETTPRPTEDPILVQRLPPPQFRPIPVHVDENGYIRGVPTPTPYPLPVSLTPIQKFNPHDRENDIDQISPPVSTKDFQRLLQQLIMRQSRLERISALTDPRRHPEFYQPRQIYRPQPQFYPQRHPEQNYDPRYVPVNQHQVGIRHQDSSYIPNKRVARIIPQQQEDEYLPPDVREMLLLRMLQLAINPALPLDDENAESSTPIPQYKKVPVRNVEILGEEAEDDRRLIRNKRYRNSDFNYYDRK